MHIAADMCSSMCYDQKQAGAPAQDSDVSDQGELLPTSMSAQFMNNNSNSVNANNSVNSYSSDSDFSINTNMTVHTQQQQQQQQQQQ